MLFLVHTTWSKVFWDNQNKLRKILLKDFFQIPLFWQYFFDNITPMKYRTKHKNKLIWQNYFSIFRGLKNNATCFFIKNTFITGGILGLFAQWYAGFWAHLICSVFQIAVRGWGEILPSSSTIGGERGHKFCRGGFFS